MTQFGAPPFNGNCHFENNLNSISIPTFQHLLARAIFLPHKLVYSFCKLDRSQSLFYFVPQEKVILTVKLARLMQTRQMKPFSGWTLWTSSFAASLRVTNKCLCDIVGSSKVFEFLN